MGAHKGVDTRLTVPPNLQKWLPRQIPTIDIYNRVCNSIYLKAILILAQASPRS